MENFSELVRLRRSMRKFTDEPLTPEQVEHLLKAALMAPSSKGKHAWHFVVVDDKEMLAELSRTKTVGSDFLAGAPLAVVVVGDPQESDVWVEDASVATTIQACARASSRPDSTVFGLRPTTRSGTTTST